MSRYFSVLFLLAILWPVWSSGQDLRSSPNDSIRLGGIIVGRDTIAMIFLPEQEVRDRMPPRLAKQLAKKKETIDRLRYHVYKVYPYAVTAAEVLKDVDVNLAALPDKAARKKYLKLVEKDLNGRFKGELKDLTITQGQILVKLIDRQTGKNCFHIIRELKGGFNAFVWQSVATLFSNNLKREYDPYGDDKDIEAIVRDLEQRNYYEWQRRQQGGVKVK